MILRIFAFLDFLSACSTCRSPVEQKESAPLVFMSFSVPVSTWRDLSSEMEEKGGVFVIRGVPNSMMGFLKEVLFLKAKGVSAPIELDPEYFEKYQVEEVPAFVVRKGDKYDKVTGNIRLEAALRMMAEQGETK